VTILSLWGPKHGVGAARRRHCQRFSCCLLLACPQHHTLWRTHMLGLYDVLPAIYLFSFFAPTPLQQYLTW
jgi:hypothetical protein